MVSKRLAALLLISAALVPAAFAAAPPKKRQEEKKKRPTVALADEDPEAAKERYRAERKKDDERPELVGPEPLRAPGLREAAEAATGYRPVDTALTNPAFDGFPASFHAEPSIAASGSDVVCVFNDGGSDAASPNPGTTGSTDGFSISTDGGKTFVDQGKRAPATGFTSFNGDNVVAKGPDGDFYYLSDAGLGGGAWNAMAVSRSTDGGKTWTASVNASAGVVSRFEDFFFDKGWIAVDGSGSATRGNVYVVFSDFSMATRQTDLYVSRSTDRGKTWSARRLDSFAHPIAVTYVQVAANGHVYVGEQDEGAVVNGAFTGTNHLRVSKDGGVTWGPLLPAGPYAAAGNRRAMDLCTDPGFFGGLVRYLTGPIEADSSLRIAVDPSDPDGRTVYVATQAIPSDRPGDDSDVFVWRTTDGGLTFSPPIRVNDDRTRTDQFMPDLWVAPDGTVGVLWLDRRNDARSNWKLEAWMAISRDRGQTWSCSFPVSSQPFPPIGRCQMSDYNGVFADDRAFHLAWGDGRQVDSQGQTTFAIYGATVPLGGPGPILSLASAERTAAGGITFRVRNDGTENAKGLTATVIVDDNLSLAPIQTNVPFPEVPACHGVVEARLPVIFAVVKPFATGTITLEGPLGKVSFPFTLVLPQTEKALGRLGKTDFETTATSDWTPAPGSLWHLTSNCAATDPGHSGTRVAYYGLEPGCNYNVLSGTTPARVFGSLTSRKLTLPPGSARIRFKEWYGLPAVWGSDVVTLQISTDGGASFESVWGYGRMSRSVPDAATPVVGSNGRPLWRTVDVDLSDYAARDVVLRFFFNGRGRASPGYAVDDLEVYAVSTDGTAAAGTCASPHVLAPEEAVEVSVHANNEGSAARAGEPASPCATSSSHPYWLEFTPPVSGTYLFRACPGASGSVGTLSVWSGASCGAGTLAGCSASPCEKPVEVMGEAGAPLRILVTSLAPDLAEKTGTFIVSVTPRLFTELVPSVLDVTSGFGSYRTELALTNPGGQPASVTLTYTASIGEGSGRVTETLAAGRQLQIADTIAYLRDKGLSIPRAGSQLGTLLVSSDSAVSATARTLSPTVSPAGAASLAYAGIAAGESGALRKTVFGLRTNAVERSKVAVFGTGSKPVTVRITAVSGDGDGRRAVVRDAETLPAYGFLQLEDPLSSAGIANGSVVVERLSSEGTFNAYGVVNSNGTNDGSYLPALSSGAGGERLTVPVLVETDRFSSELILANQGSTKAVVTLRYRESLSPALGAGGAATLTLEPGRQLLIPNAVDYLRKNGVALGSAGSGSFAGALRVEADVPVSNLFAAARTSSKAPSRGTFGLFTPGVFQSGDAATTMWLDGLRKDADNRTNVAVVNTSNDASVTLRLQVLDGDTGQPRGDPRDVSLQPGEWAQPAGFFDAAGAANGYVRVTRVSGNATWLAYAVVNDGGAPGQRTDDGAYVAMRP